MGLVKRIFNVEDHLGIETGPFEKEKISMSGNHKDVVEGTFNLQESFKPKFEGSSLPG